MLFEAKAVDVATTEGAVTRRIKSSSPVSIPLPWQLAPRLAVTWKVVSPTAVEVVVVTVSEDVKDEFVVAVGVPNTATAPVGSAGVTPSVTVQLVALPLSVTVTVP